MEELRGLVASLDLTSPLLFWTGTALVLLLIFLPLFRKRRGLALDLGYWGRKVEFKSRRVWVFSGLATISSLLMAMALPNPQIATKTSVPKYGKPVMIVIDVSGSMEYRGRPGQEGLSSFEKARGVYDDLLNRNVEADFGLLLYSTEHYVARYFAPENALLEDTLHNEQEISLMSTGTRTAEALAQARRFFSEKVEAEDKAIILISDLNHDLEATMQMAEETERVILAGIRMYVIVVEREGRQAVERHLSQSDMQGVTMVDMNDKYGIDQICREIAAMQSSPIIEEQILAKKSLVPFLVGPALALLSLCLVLSETRFLKIP
jgi:Mg-chelatase subunit ChlD